VALGLAAGLTPGDVRNLYVEHAREIFDDSWLDDLRDLGGLSGAEYDNKRLRRLLEQTFGDRTLARLRQRVLVPAFDLDNDGRDGSGRAIPRRWTAKFFHNFPGSDSDGGCRVVDVALASSAAPTYFPTWDGFVDGGVVANNPAMSAVAQALDPDNPAGERARLDEVRVLSIGSGANLQHVAGARLDWGKAQWVGPLVRLMLDGSVGVVDYQCRQLLGDAYRRVDPELAAGTVIAMDDVRRVPELLAIAADVDLGDVPEWLGREWLVP
jgi:uncharacterized protein